MFPRCYLELVMSSRFLREREAAEYLGVSRSWLAQGRIRGSELDTPPYLKLGRSVRYDRDDLDAWLEQRRRGSVSA